VIQINELLERWHLFKSGSRAAAASARQASAQQASAGLGPQPTSSLAFQSTGPIVEGGGRLGCGTVLAAQDLLRAPAKAVLTSEKNLLNTEAKFN